MPTAKGTFEIEMKAGPAELDGEVGRLDFTKIFHGDLTGTGRGVLLSGGDPARGAAGYVAIETVTGRLGDRRGGFAMQQFGTMRDGEQTLHWEVVPGSGQGQLEGVAGRLRLIVEQDGTHAYELEYEV